MKMINSLATDYWIDNTARIYKENLHVSTPVIDAYEAGFKKAREMAIDRIKYCRYSIVLENDNNTFGYINACSKIQGEISILGEGDDGFGPSLAELCTEHVPEEKECPECKGSGLPTRKHSDLADKCEDCNGTGKKK